jgi:hypothetical protein
MTILSSITNCFLDIDLPLGIVELELSEDSDRRDALAFTKTKWRDVTWEKWQKHRGAFYGFQPPAFKYFLPSILYLSAQRAEEWFSPADCLIQVLDRSSKIDHLDEFIVSRLTGLSSCVYDVMSEWLIFLSESRIYNYEGALDRAIDTIALLEFASRKN